MPTVWNLRMPLLGESDATRFQLVYAQLLTDPAVERLSVIDSAADPFSRQLTVTFREGYTRPLNTTLHALDKQYPDTRTDLEQILTLAHRLDETMSAVQALRPSVNPCGEVPLGTHGPAADFRPKPLKPSEVPAWIRPGAWVRYEDVPHKILRVGQDGAQWGVLTAILWASDDAPLVGLVLTSDYVNIIQPCHAPSPLRSWFERILDDE